MKKLTTVLIAVLCFCGFMFVGCSQAPALNEGDYMVTAEMNISRQYLASNESFLANTVTDAMLEKTKADLTIIDAKSFNEQIKIPKGSFGKDKIKTIIPEGRNVVTKRLSGSTILSLAKDNVSIIVKADEDEKIGLNYMHFCGATFVYSKKVSTANSIVESKVYNKDSKQWVTIDADSYYVVAMNSSLAEDKDYFGIVNADVLSDYGNEIDIVGEFLATQKGFSSSIERFVDKAQNDAPITATLVLVSIGILILIIVFIAVFLSKRKTEKIRKANNHNEPRIDV